MGLIRIEDMEFYAFHGHYREEQIVGNHFLVDVTIETDTDKAGKSDELRDTLNYQTAYLLVKKGDGDHLQIFSSILPPGYLTPSTQELAGIKKATVKVSKLNPGDGWPHRQGECGTDQVKLPRFCRGEIAVTAVSLCICQEASTAGLESVSSIIALLQSPFYLLFLYSHFIQYDERIRRDIKA
ncbi:MAG: dihydroneopterin aldolase [Marinilabiliales bacterium]|nr:dihydroneopterin aldolase [Marinilabiliales bacterium]